MFPLLQKEDGAALARSPVGDRHDTGGLDERWVLRAIDEAGQVEIVVVRPTDHLMGESRERRQRHDHGPRQIEDDVVATSR